VMNHLSLGNFPSCSRWHKSYPFNHYTLLQFYDVDSNQFKADDVAIQIHSNKCVFEYRRTAYGDVFFCLVAVGHCQVMPKSNVK
jgi:hypothetical protein